MTIVDYIKSKIHLKYLLTQEGHIILPNQKMVCPFCGSGTGPNKTPAFHVYNDGVGYYRCFSCGKHGDIINYVQNKYELSFLDAVDKLKTLIDIPDGTVFDKDNGNGNRYKNLPIPMDVRSDIPPFYKDMLLFSFDNMVEALSYIDPYPFTDKFNQQYQNYLIKKRVREVLNES